jgi:hypothetical protein
MEADAQKAGEEISSGFLFRCAASLASTASSGQQAVCSLLSKQIIVLTAQRLLKPFDCRRQNIQLPGLNLLDGARGKIRQFR